jgi:hypothetical protein
MLLSISCEIIPFQIKRVFTLSPSSNLEPRGGHAHKTCWQLIFPVAGEILVEFANIRELKTLKIVPSLGILIPPWNWCKVYFESTNSHAVVICSDVFNQDDYVYDKPART